MINPFSAAWKVAAKSAELAGSIVGLRWGTEQPRYRVEDRVGGLEVRHYGPRIAAETTVLADDAAALNIGFRRLAGYIFGDNRRGAKIAMTAPVAQQSNKRGDSIAMTAPVSQTPDAHGGSVIRFFMPAKSTMDSLPPPADETVRLTEVPAETVAVLRFTGDRSPEAIARKTRALCRALDDSGYQPAGTPLAWFYDPPFTIPFRRRNEVAVPVTHRRRDI